MKSLQTSSGADLLQGEQAHGTAAGRGCIKVTVSAGNNSLQHSKATVAVMRH
jgi:hypothetical protein